MSNLVGGKKASEILGVHQRTLYQWDKKGWIKTLRTPGGKRLYDVEDYIRRNSKIDKKKIGDVDDIVISDRMNICYCRVSTNGQKDDLQRQIEELKEKYDDYIFITDIGSGINFNRKGLIKIIDLAITGKINEIVVAYKDRLARFGYNLIEYLVKKYSDGKIVILNDKKDMDPEEELVYDVLQILNVFTAKMNGLRKYKKVKEEKNLLVDN